MKRALRRAFPRAYKWLTDRLNGYDKLRRRILEDAAQNPQLYNNEELKSTLRRLRRFGVEVVPFDGAEKYETLATRVNVDEEGYPWVWHGGKKLFFRRERGAKIVERCYAGLVKEQDATSPHCYKFEVESGGVLMDVGSAEGIYALDNVEVASRIVLFEVDPEWIGALERTFAPWRDKVLIINNFASDVDDGQSVTIDSVIGEHGIEGPLLLKLDVEGAEKRVLNGATAALARADTRAVVCTYHRHDDHARLSEAMRERGFWVETSRGYMLFVFDRDMRPPFFRRGVIYCCK